MAKKRKSNRTKYTSYGMHSNVSASTRKALRRDYMASGERILNQQKAFKLGKNVMVTIENPNKLETNKRFIRVNAKDIWRTFPK